MGIKSLTVRVGFHSGPVISHAADVFGDTVNVAARVVAHAKPGQILVAKQTVRRLPKEVAPPASSAASRSRARARRSSSTSSSGTTRT